MIYPLCLGACGGQTFWRSGVCLLLFSEFFPHRTVSKRLSGLVVCFLGPVPVEYSPSSAGRTPVPYGHAAFPMVAQWRATGKRAGVLEFVTSVRVVCEGGALRKKVKWYLVMLLFVGVASLLLTSTVLGPLPRVWCPNPYDAEACLGRLKHLWRVAVLVFVTVVYWGAPFVWSSWQTRRRHVRVHRTQVTGALDAMLGHRAREIGPTEFEYLVCELLLAAGWKAHVVGAASGFSRGGPGDGGMDVVGEAGGERIVISCKQLSRPASPSVVRDLQGVRVVEGFDRAALAASNGASRQAEMFAERAGIELIDLSMLNACVVDGAIDPIRAARLVGPRYMPERFFFEDLLEGLDRPRSVGPVPLLVGFVFVFSLMMLGGRWLAAPSWSAQATAQRTIGVREERVAHASATGDATDAADIVQGIIVDEGVHACELFSMTAISEVSGDPLGWVHLMPIFPPPETKSLCQYELQYSDRSFRVLWTQAATPAEATSIFDMIKGGMGTVSCEDHTLSTGRWMSCPSAGRHAFVRNRHVLSIIVHGPEPSPVTEALLADAAQRLQ